MMKQIATVKRVRFFIGNYQSQVDDFLKGFEKDNVDMGISDNYICFSEDKILEQIMTQKEHPLKALHSWRRKYLQEVKEYIIKNCQDLYSSEETKKIYISGKFLLDSKNLEELTDALIDMGYEVSRTLLETGWLSILQSALKNSENIKEVCDDWDYFNKEYGSQYKELEEYLPNAIIVSLENALFEPNDVFNYYEGCFNGVISTAIKSWLSEGYRIIFIADRPKKEINKTVEMVLNHLNLNYDLFRIGKEIFFYNKDGTSLLEFKKRLFDSKLSRTYKIKYILETDADLFLYWRKVGVPTMFIGNPFKLTNKET